MTSRILSTLALSCVCTFTAAQNSFPSQPLTILVPFPPGGTTDVIPRLLQPILSEKLKTTVIVENKPGANGTTGAGVFARAKPDGHTIMMATTGVYTVNQWLYKQLPYTPERDFAPITNAAYTPTVLVVHPSVPAQNLGELIKLAKAKPNELTFASSGMGSASHLCGELLRNLTGIEITHIPYKGPAPANNDLLAGRVTMMCDAASNVMTYVNGGRLRALAMASTTRDKSGPDVPTGAEAGLPGFEMSVWFGFTAPSGTPDNVVTLLNKEITSALRSPSIVERLESRGLTIVADNPRDFGQYMALESSKWRKLISVSKIVIE